MQHTLTNFNKTYTAADWILKFGGDFGGHMFIGGFMAAAKYSANPDIRRLLARLTRIRSQTQMHGAFSAIAERRSLIFSIDRLLSMV